MDLRLSGTWQRRGAIGDVQVSPKTSSSISPVSVYAKDLVGCGSPTHKVFQRSISINVLTDCKIENVGFMSLSGGVKIGDATSEGVIFDNLLDTIQATLNGTNFTVTMRSEVTSFGN